MMRFFLAAAGLFLALPLLAEEGPRRLEPGVPLERELAGGGEHAYLVEIAAGGHVLVTADQRGIDVVVEAAAPDGRSLGAIDTPTGRTGEETLLLSAETGAGLYRVDIKAPGKEAGRYEVRAERLPASTPAERERLEAERLFTEAARLYGRKTAEATREAAAAARNALAHWRTLGRRREEARTLSLLGELQSSLGERREALGSFEQALAVWEELGETGRQASALSRIGLTRLAFGEQGEALAFFERALVLQREGGDRLGAAGSLNNICLVQHSQSKLSEALACYQRALGLAREAEAASLESKILSNIGGVYDLLGEPRQALDHYEKARAAQGLLGDRNGQAQTLNNLGVAFAAIGELGEALSRYDQALDIFRAAGNRFWEARTLHNLGAAYSGLGEPRRARASFEEALALRRAVGDRRGEVLTLNHLGQVLRELGETKEARGLFHKALETARALGDRSFEAASLNLLGQALLAEGDLDRALATLDQSVEILKGLEDRRELAFAVQRRGEAHARRGDFFKAREAFGEALALRREIADRPGQVETLTAAAQAEARLGRLPEARARVGEALGLLETLRVTVAAPELRASFFAAHRQAFELEVDLLMRLHRQEPEAGHARKALEVSERARARALLDLLEEARADVRAGADPELLRREKDLAQRLNAKAVLQVERLSGAPAGARDSETAERELQSLLAELDTVRAEIRSRSPHYAALTQPSPLGAEAIQALLDPGTLLLEFAMGEERSFLWAVDAGSIAAFELPPRAEIEAAARRVYERMRSLDAGAGKEEAEAAAALSRALLGPVAGRLGERRLVIVADGALHYLPFAALPVPEGSSGPVLLVDRHEILTLPSASVLATQRRELGPRPPALRQVAVLADPVFDSADSRVPKPGPAPSRAAAGTPGERSGGPADFPVLARLSATRLEAERIAALVPKDQSLVALDFAADRGMVLTGGLASYRIVHFATHGVIDARTPELSGLVLSQVGPDGKPREGFLGLPDIYSLQLGADLVVLSGCETALGREIRGEGLVGLTRGFLHAGAARVVASLWRVQDRA
ncbi:MAG TPA: CHAT domain-containing tetratricopeptide repeat protein, partial [Thermoanaerobaculia bacterium]|nr:CHAT domain-containing tetratricopeptide repeat protein [Thermoanaerobaculia bacterium]